MLELTMRPSLRFVQQISRIERFAGSWERLARSSPLAIDPVKEASLAEGVEAVLALDSSSPAGLFLRTDEEQNGAAALIREKRRIPNVEESEPLLQHVTLETLAEAHRRETPITREGIDYLFRTITHQTYDTINWVRPTDILEYPAAYRTTSSYFLNPDRQVVFPTTSAFLIEERLEELVQWTERELESGILHPLAIIGTFHLLFLQISPYPAANHRLSLVLVWQLLVANGYDFVRFSHFAPSLRARRWQYFSALRQAEKTAYADWSTLNGWLELFVDTLIESSAILSDAAEECSRRSRLTPVQKRIIEVVRTHGSATREVIATETGINISTVKYNLSVLAGAGQLRREGGGRTTSYTIA